jgi:hypothetical protein
VSTLGELARRTVSRPDPSLRLTKDESMQDLIERLEKATGPDRELDLAIGEAVGEANHSGPAFHRPFREWARHYTASIDAALTLVEHLHWQVEDFNLDRTFRAQIAEQTMTKFGPAVGIRARAKGATPAIALCIAALKARTAVPGTPA